MAERYRRYRRKRLLKKAKFAAAVRAAHSGPGNPLLELQQSVGNHATQQHIQQGEASPSLGLQRLLGNQAVARLGGTHGRRLLRQIITDGAEHDPVANRVATAVAGKGAEKINEGAVLAGRLRPAAVEAARHRDGIARFQRSIDRRRIMRAQEALLGPASGRKGGDRSNIMRKKGKKTAGPTPNVSHATVDGPSTEKHGGFSWAVQWKLDNPSTQGGWVVQKVTSAGDIKTRDGKRVATAYGNWHPFWEAWKVNPGESVTEYAEGGDVLDDTYGHPSLQADTEGSIEVLGSAQFYEGLKLPKAFKANQQSPAGILPMTQSEPGLTGGSAVNPHNLKATWDGVNGDGTTAAAVT